MNELIHISEKNGKQVVSAKELYDFLEIKSNFTTWTSRMFEYGFQENMDFIPILEKSTGGRPSIDYALTLDCAKEIAMIQRTPQGKQAREYFISCEKMLKEIAKPMSTLDILKLTIQSMEEQRVELEEVKKDVLALKAKTTTDSDYVTIMGYAVIKNKNVPRSMAALLGKRAANICKSHNIPMDSIFDPRFGKVRLYPMSILERVFSESV